MMGFLGLVRDTNCQNKRLVVVCALVDGIAFHPLHECESQRVLSSCPLPQILKQRPEERFMRASLVVTKRQALEPVSEHSNFRHRVRDNARAQVIARALIRDEVSHVRVLPGLWPKDNASCGAGAYDDGAVADLEEKGAGFRDSGKQQRASEIAGGCSTDLSALFDC